MNRIDRLSAILIQLQSKRVVTAGEIAERFSISLRTVYRDIRALEEAGIPLYGETGIGYSLMDGYRLPPVMFTRDEATAFLTAEKLVSKLADYSLDESYKSAMFKIKSVLRNAEKDYLEVIDTNIEVLGNPYLPENTGPAIPMQAIIQSIAEKTRLAIDYFANHNQEHTKREIEPVGIFYQHNKWHVIAYCHLRKDYRNFRIDRISAMSLLNKPFLKEHPSLKSYLKQVSKKEALSTIVIRVSKDIMKHFGEQKYYNGFVSQKELKGQVEMTFLTSSLEGFARWYMMFGDFAKIVSPAGLKTRVKDIAAQISLKQ